MTDSDISSIVDENKHHGKLAMLKSVSDMNFVNGAPNQTPAKRPVTNKDEILYADAIVKL